MSRFAHTVELLIQQGTPSRLPGSWATLSCDPALFDLPDDGKGLVQRLQERLPLRTLIDTGLVQIEPDGGVELSDLLARNNRYLRPLWKRRAKHPFELFVGAGGSLSGQLPSIAALDDREISSRVERTGGRLFIADSASDVAILYSLGLPVAPAHGVDCLYGERIDTLFEKLGMTASRSWESDLKEVTARSRSNRAKSSKPQNLVSLVVVNWRPSQLDLEDVPRAVAIQRQLVTLAERLGIPLDDCSLWKPSPARLEQLKYALDCGAVSHVPQVLLDGFEEDCVVLDRWPLTECREPRTLAEAVTAMQFPDEQGNRAAESQTQQQFQRLLHGDLIEPMLQQAAETSEPLVRNLLYVLAGLSEEFHTEMWFAGAGSRNRARSDAGPPRGESKSLGQQLARIKLILNVTKVFKSW